MALWGFPRSGYGASAADEYGRRRWRGGQSGYRRRAKQYDVTVLLPAIYLMGNPLRMSAAVSVLPKSTPNNITPHIIAVRAINALLSIWVMQLIVLIRSYHVPTIRRGVYLIGRVRTCLRQKTGARDVLPRMAKLLLPGADIPAISYRTVR